MTHRTVLVLLLGACAQGTELDSPQVGEPMPVDAAPAPAPCGMAFDPAPELLGAAEAAARRWSAATGCDVRVQAGGIPIVAWPRLFVEYTDDGHALLSEINHGGAMKSICGLSTWERDQAAIRIIDVSLACDVDYALAHEMGHALAGVKGHAASGVLAAADDPDRSTVIDEHSLGGVYYSFPCASFVPEAP